jgi:hypothetical protein
VYQNRIEWNASYRILHFRAGSQLVWGNTLLDPSGSRNEAITLAEPEGWGKEAWQNLTAWPANDPINNSFYWDNTFNGSPLTGKDIGLTLPADATFIEEGRDFFMHAPAASGGRRSGQQCLREHCLPHAPRLGVSLWPGSLGGLARGRLGRRPEQSLLRGQRLLRHHDRQRLPSRQSLCVSLQHHKLGQFGFEHGGLRLARRLETG